MSQLLSTQQAFSACLARLLDLIIHTEGWAVTLGEAYRPPETALLYAEQGRGIADSNHPRSLAIDLNFFYNGHYVTDSARLEPFGRAWEGFHKLAAWGGRFTKPDGGHFSFVWQGVK